jgi:nucleotide-binding universal stress UspA family protein
VSARVVVGVDGSRHARAALRWGLQHASATGARVTAVLAWSFLDQRHLPGEESFDPRYDADEAGRVLRTLVDEVRDELGPDAPEVTCLPVLDLPARALLDAAQDADLLVVGSRGLGGVRGMLLGSVSQQVVTHAPCPVVVHRTRDGD